MNTNALLLTAYEKYGTVGMDDFIECFIDEDVEVDESLIGAYNEYLSNNGYEEYWDDLDEMLEGMTPTEVARATFYGNFRYCAEYHQFNGYANIDSFDAYEVVKEMENDSNFLRWYVEENDLIDEDEAQEIINEANALIRKGY